MTPRHKCASLCYRPRAYPSLPQVPSDAAHRELQHTSSTGLRSAYCWQVGPVLDLGTYCSKVMTLVHLQASLSGARHPLLDILAILANLPPPAHAVCLPT